MTTQVGRLEQLAEVTYKEKNQEKRYSLLKELGDGYSVLKKYQQAIQFYNEALDVANDLGDTRAESTLYGRLANVYLSLGEIDRATDLFRKGTALIEDEKRSRHSVEEVVGGVLENRASISSRKQLNQVKTLLLTILFFLGSATLGIGVNLLSSIDINGLTTNLTRIAIITIILGLISLFTGFYIRFMRK